MKGKRIPVWFRPGRRPADTEDPLACFMGDVKRSDIEAAALEVMAGDAGQEIIERAAWNVLEELGCQMKLGNDAGANETGVWVVAIARALRQGLRRKWERMAALRPMRERAEAIRTRERDDPPVNPEPQGVDRAAGDPGSATLQLRVRVAARPQESVGGDIPLRLPPGMTLADIRVGGDAHIPLLAYGCVHKPLASLSVQMVGPRTLKAVGEIAVPAHKHNARSLWNGIAEGVVEAAVHVKGLRPEREGFELLAISLEIAGPEWCPSPPPPKRGPSDVAQDTPPVVEGAEPKRACEDQESVLKQNVPAAAENAREDRADEGAHPPVDPVIEDAVLTVFADILTDAFMDNQKLEDAIRKRLGRWADERKKRAAQAPKTCVLCGRSFEKGGDTIALRVESLPRLTLDPRPICPRCANEQEPKAKAEDTIDPELEGDAVRKLIADVLQYPRGKPQALLARKAYAQRFKGRDGVEVVIGVESVQVVNGRAWPVSAVLLSAIGAQQTDRGILSFRRIEEREEGATPCE